MVDGSNVGDLLGYELIDGLSDGWKVSSGVGTYVGDILGLSVGVLVGCEVGEFDGDVVGVVVGIFDGCYVKRCGMKYDIRIKI